jgi:hypothetical protein
VRDALSCCFAVNIPSGAQRAVAAAVDPKCSNRRNGFGLSSDDVSRGIRRLEEDLAIYYRLGLRTNLRIMICLLAEAYFVAAEYERGRQKVDLAIDTSAEIGDRWCLPRIHTVQAQLLRASGEIGAAEASLRKAVDIPWRRKLVVRRAHERPHRSLLRRLMRRGSPLKSRWYGYQEEYVF